ncbi:MAG: tetratricopeptide repeat protein [Flavobacteriales bacterium]
MSVIAVEVALNKEYLNAMYHKIILLCGVIMLALTGATQSNPLDQAREAYAEKDYSRALSAADLQIQQQATPEAYMLRADCLHKLEDYNHALDDYDKARQQGYLGDDLYLNRGICKISIELYDGARADLMSYLQKNENDPKGYYWLAVIEYMNAENKACQRYIDEAIFLDSTYAEAYYLRGANYVDTKKNNLAYEDFSIAYQLKPDLHRAKLNMATLLIDMGRFKYAIEVLTELKLEDPTIIKETLYYRGEAMYNMHDMEGACGDWVEAAEMGDEDSEDMYKRLCIDKNDKPRFKRSSYFQF